MDIQKFVFRLETRLGRPSLESCEQALSDISTSSRQCESSESEM